MPSVLAIECGIDPDYEGRLMASAAQLGWQVLVVAWDKGTGSFCLSDLTGNISDRPVPTLSLQNRHVWFHGSIQASVAAQEHTDWQVHAPWVELRCSSYYPKLQDYLFQKGWLVLSLGEFVNQRDILYCVADILFVRPDTNDKVFSGGCVSLENWDASIKNILFYDPPMDTMVVVAVPRQVVSEARFLVVGRKLVTGSYYKIAGSAIRLRITSESPIWAEAEKLLAVCLQNQFDPSGSWVLDIAEDTRGMWEIIEVGGTAYCGMYACDTDAFLGALQSA